MKNIFFFSKNVFVPSHLNSHSNKITIMFIWEIKLKVTQVHVAECEKCSNTVLFLVRIFPHSDWIRSISPYYVQMRENKDQKNSEYGHFLRSGTFIRKKLVINRSYRSKLLLETFLKLITLKINRETRNAWLFNGHNRI